MNHKITKLACATLAVCFLYGCGKQGSTTEISSQAIKKVTLLSAAEDRYKEEDLDATWSETDSTVLTFSQDGVTVDGNGAAVKNQILEITSGGVYVCRGSWNGQIRINTAKTQLVRLIFDDFQLKTAAGYAIYAEQSDKVMMRIPQRAGLQLMVASFLFKPAMMACRLKLC